ncbi:MAG: glycoside hydrolase family 127 protein [Phycisphaerae bacterium]
MKTVGVSTLVLATIAAVCPLLVADEAGSTVRARPFPLERVRLLDSPFKTAMEINRAYLLRLDPDRFLWPYHERAGLPPKGERYGGWAKKDCVGQMSGHYLSACSLMHASTGDPELKKRVDYMVAEIAKVQAEHGNGYAGPVRPEVWETTFSGRIKVHKWGLGGGYVPWYVLHKTYAGLIDAYTCTGNTQALDVARQFVDWAKKGTDKLTDDQFQKMLRCEHGGMNEAMANLYALTADPNHLALAGRFDHKQIFGPLEAERDELHGKHANTQLPKIVGAARLYELTGEERYATIARFFWDRVVETRSYAPGGVDFHEHFRAQGEEAGEEAKFLNWDSCETCCVYNMLKLTRHLFGWRPDARYMDYYERALYNHILGSQDPASGGVTYFYSLRPGHFKIYSTPFDSMWCCVGTGMENHSKYGETIYYHDENTLWVNLFIPSELDWKEKGVTVRQETRFPREQTTTITISTNMPRAFAVRIRVPYWATPGAEVWVNGRKETVDAPPQSYVILSRTWKEGDTIEVRLPMRVRLYRARDDRNLGVVMFGPLVLAGELGREGVPENLACAHNKQYSGAPVPMVPVLVTDAGDPASWVKRTVGEDLRFRTQNVGKPADVSLIPLHRMHHQRYTVYWRLLTQDEWLKEKAAREAEERRRKELDARTVDVVTPEAGLERAHHQQGERSHAGAAFGRRWRDARGGGWFSYDMKVLPDRPVHLIVTYWGGDSGNRVFDILIDGRKIATQTLKAPKPGEFTDVTYAVPADLTKGRRRVTVRFQADPGAWAGGVFGCRIVRPSGEPSAAEALLQTLDPFYKQHVVADGLLVAGSEKVSQVALREAAYLLRKMLAGRPDVLENLVARKMYVCVMAYNEMQTDLPECRGMSPWWDKRARGLGGKPVSCGEENLLGFDGDPYAGENILIHEFGHAIHGALARLDEQFNTRLRALYQKAKETGRFRGYGMGSFGEFWAEGVQSWFECNRRGGLEALGAEGAPLCHINTRQQLKKHLPAFAELLDEAFRQNAWAYVPVRKRLDQPHLRGYEPADAPTFRWPPEVIEAYNRIEAERAEKRKKQ